MTREVTSEQPLQASPSGPLRARVSRSNLAGGTR